MNSAIAILTRRPSLVCRFGLRCNIHTIAFNTGSSSLKYSVYDVERSVGRKKTLAGSLISSGSVDKVGKSDAVFKVAGKTVFKGLVRTHEEGIKKIVEHLHSKIDAIEVVGHRVVHGGSTFTRPTIVDSEVLRKIDEYSVLAPLHNPPAIAGLKAARAIFPNAPNVAVFDSAFHSSMPPSSYRYALPTSLYEDYKIRRYGFHGISFK